MVDDSLGEAIDGGEAIETVTSDSQLALDDSLHDAGLDGGDAREQHRAHGMQAAGSEGAAGSGVHGGARGEAWVRDACQRLSACADCEQLEEIIFDEAQRFVPAVLDAAFVALARVGFGKCLPLHFSEGVCDAAYRTLLSEATLAGTSGHDLRGMGAVLLAHALDMLQSCEPAHMIAMLQAMGLMGLVVEDDIMLDFVRHIVLTLDSFDASAVVHVLLGLAMLEHQPDENSLRAFESKVSALTAHFDTGAQKTLLWCFERLGRAEDVQSAREAYRREMKGGNKSARSREPVRAKAVFLHGEELRQSFHPKLLRCPLLMHRRTALPPKHVRDGSILAMNERPAFSLRFTNPWAVEQMQRAEEHRERVRTDRKPLLKGQRDKIYRSVRMRNMLKRFVAEDDQLILNPNQTEKDQELCDELSRIKIKHGQALKEWRSEEHKERAALQTVAEQLQAGVEQKQAALAHAQSHPDAGSPPQKPLRENSAPSEVSQRSDSEDYLPAPRKVVTAQVLWARFPKNMFSGRGGDCSGADSGGGDGWEVTDQNPELHYFELWIDGVSMHQRTAGIPWTAESEWYDSFSMSEPWPDARVELVWNYKTRAGGETCVGGVACLDWKTIDLASSNEVVLSLDIRERRAESDTLGDGGGEQGSKVGACSVHLGYQEKLEHLTCFARLPSTSLVPPNEDQVAKCTRLLKKEIQFAEKKLKEAENKADALQSQRWQALQDLEEQHAELVQAIILHRRVFGLAPKEDDPVLGAIDSTEQLPNSAKSTCSRRSGVKGAVYAQSLPFYSFTASGEESLSIGVFDAATSVLNSLASLTPIYARPRHLSTSRAPSSTRQLDEPTMSPVQAAQSSSERAAPERLEADASSAVGTPRTPKTPHTPMSALSSVRPISAATMSVASPRAGSRPPSRLSSPSHTFPEPGSATARSRRRSAGLDQEREALPEFDANPPPATVQLSPNVIRSVMGVDSRNPAPGSRPTTTEENTTRSPLVQHDQPFDMRFYANDPTIADMYVHSKMKPPLMRQEGFLKHYLKAREMALTRKLSPSRRDSQWDPGPEQMPKDRATRAWRWDSQPIYPPPQDGGRQSRSPRRRYRYKRHITHADASAISAWPRGSPRPPSSATTPTSSRRPGTARDSSKSSTPRTAPTTPAGAGNVGPATPSSGGRRTVSTPRGSREGRGTEGAKRPGPDIRPATAPSPAANMHLPVAPTGGKSSS